MDRRAAQCENVKMAPVKKQLGPLGPTFLKEWREHAGLDQEAAATQLNVSRTLLSKIEGRKSPYTQRHLEIASKAYGCEPWELLVVNPMDKDSFWPLFKRAEDLAGDRRAHVRDIIAATLGKPSQPG
jgi:transcriptional regulator with XRE-family HTH domain